MSRLMTNRIPLWKPRLLNTHFTEYEGSFTVVELIRHGTMYAHSILVGIVPAAITKAEQAKWQRHYKQFFKSIGGASLRFAVFNRSIFGKHND